MSLHILGGVDLRTGNQSATANGQTNCGIKLKYKYLADPSKAGGSMAMGRASYGGFAIRPAGPGALPGTVKVSFYITDSAGGQHSTTVDVTAGDVHDFVLTNNGSTQLVYVDGTVKTISNFSGATLSGVSALVLPAYDGTAPVDSEYIVDDPFFWNGYTPTPTDVINMRNGTDPGTIGGGAASRLRFTTNVPAGKAIGDPVAIGDSGLSDSYGSGLAFSSLNFQTTGTLKYDSPLVWVPTIKILEARISTCGSMLFIWTGSISTGAQTTPTVINSLPGLVKNGTPIVAPLTNALISPEHGFVSFSLPSGVSIAPGDVVNLNAPLEWCDASGVARSETNLSVVNYSGVSCFGTDSVARTLRMGVNMEMYPVSSNGLNWLVKNVARVMSAGTGVATRDANNYPLTLTGTSAEFTVYSNSAASLPNLIDSTGYPGPTGLMAIGWDDLNPANPTTWALASSNTSTTTVSLVYENLGVSGIGRVRIYDVQRAAGSNVAVTDIKAVLTQASGVPQYQNLLIFLPGEYTNNGNATTLSLADPYAISQDMANKYRGAGSIRAWFNLLGSANSPASEPEHIRKMSDFSWGLRSSLEFISVGYSSVSPFSLASDPWYYLSKPLGQKFSATLGTGIDNVTTTLNITDAATAKVIRGLRLFLDSGTSSYEVMRVENVSGTTVTVKRGMEDTVPVAHAAGPIQVGYRLPMYDLNDGTFDAGLVIKFNTSGNHNLMTGQTITCDGTWPTITGTDGRTLTISSGTGFNPVIVTGPDSFIMRAGSGTPSVTLNGTTTLNPAVNTTTLRIGNYSQIPYGVLSRIATQLNVRACHFSIPHMATNDMKLAIFREIRDNIDSSIDVYIEISNETWNQGAQYVQQQIYFWGLTRSLYSVNSPRLYSYTKETGDTGVLARQVFNEGGRNRGYQIKMFLNVNYAVPGDANALLTWAAAQAPPVLIDAVANAPYLDTGDMNLFGTTTKLGFANLNPDQGADLWIHALRNRIDGSGLINLSNTFKTNIATYNSATGQNCKYISYEGGLQQIYVSSLTNFKERSRDAHYNPNWYIIEKDIYAYLQSCGYEIFNLFCSSSSYNSSNGYLWGLYKHIQQQYGRGDGTDGKANNLNCLATPGFPNTKSPTTNLDLTNVSVRGQAWLDWNASTPVSGSGNIVLAAMNVSGTGQYYQIANVPSYMHTWFNEPVGVKKSNATYYGVMADDGTIGIARYDHSKYIIEVGNPRGLTVAPTVVDDHNNPAVLPLSNGKILAAYSEHPGKCWASLSPNADDVSGVWTETQICDGSTYYNSYAHLCQTTDAQNTIFWFFRDGQTAVGGMPVCFRINQGGGAGGSWTPNVSRIKLINNFDTANQRPYLRITQSGLRIDICYTSGHPDEIVPCYLYHFYILISSDGTQFGVYRSDDSLIDVWPMTGGTGIINSTSLPLNVTAGTKIFGSTGTDNAWIWDVKYVQGTLTCLYPVFTQTTSPADTHKYRRATLSAGIWTSEDICYAGDSLTPGTVGRVPQWIYPDASNAQPRYSPGICLDPNVADRVYVGKKYADGDVRIQQWDKVAGVWGKTSDLTGPSGNSRVNARPMAIEGDASTNIIWVSASPYTSFQSYSTTSPGLLRNFTISHVTKVASPVWTPSLAPEGIQAYYLMNDGSGSIVRDISGVYGGTISGGSLTWGSDSYGANLSGFSSTVAVIDDALANSGLFNSTSFPKWIAVLYKSLSSQTNEYLVGFGNSSSNNPIFGATVNNSADNQVGGNYRDSTLVSNQLSVSKIRDTNYHTLYVAVESASSVRFFSDGKIIGSASNPTGAASFNRFTIGALRRVTQGSQASGCTISAVTVGSGALPSPIHIHTDFINGQFLGTWSTSSLSSGTGSVILAGLGALGSGSFLTPASGSITTSRLSVSGAASTGISGSGSVSLTPMSAAGSAVNTATASGSVSLASMSISGSGSFAMSGTGSITLSRLLVSASASATTSGPSADVPSHIHTWFNEPIAIRYADATYCGVYSDDGCVGIMRYDHIKQIIEVGNPRGLSTAPIQLDDHNNPAVIRLNTGKILAAYSEHPGKCWASISPNADSVQGTWTETQLFDGTTYGQSYAHLFQTNDDQNTIFWFFRHGFEAGTTLPIAFRISQDGGSTWTANASVVDIVASTGERPYFRMVGSGKRIDIFYTDGHPSAITTNSLHHIYMLINQAGTQFSLYKSDDTLIDTWAMSGGTGIVNSKALPLALADGSLVYDGTTARCWIWDCRWVNGVLTACYPVFTTTTNAADTHQYRRATLSAGVWTNEDICYAGDSSVPGTVGRVPHWIYPDTATTGETYYSPGICLDPNVTDRVYLGKKYANGDVRIEQWDKAAGVWGKTSDLSGASGNGRTNARPFSVLGSNPTNIRWFSASVYTTYLSFTAVSPFVLNPFTISHTSKVASPVWASSYAPNGTKSYYLMNEGSGTVVGDVSGVYNGAVAGGSLTWGSDSYGANLSGFSNTVAVTADTLASAGFFDSTVFPKWIAVLYKSLTSATGQYLVGIGNGSSTAPLMGAIINNTADNQVGGIYRDASNAGIQTSPTKTRDTNYHTLFIVAESSTTLRIFSDGKLLGTATGTTGAVTFNRFTIGALRRTTQGNAATGSTISSVVVGSGAVPTAIHIQTDLINGQFLGTWAPISVASGSGNINMSSLIVSGVGSLLIASSGNVLLGSMAAAGAGFTGAFGSGAISMSGMTAAGAGIFGAEGSGAINLLAMITEGIASCGTFGNGDILLSQMSASGFANQNTSAFGNIVLAGALASGIGVATASDIAECQFVKVAKSISKVLVSSGNYTANQIVYVIDPNNFETWPLVDAPFCAISFGEARRIDDEGDGGGRFTKTWTQEVSLNLVVKNILNTPYNDSSVILSTNQTLGIHTKAHRVVNAIEQSYPTSDDGSLTTRELPIVTYVSAPRRYKRSYEYVVVTVGVEISWKDDLDETAISPFS